jgi:hypothetical protein
VPGSVWRSVRPGCSVCARNAGVGALVSEEARSPYWTWSARAVGAIWRRYTQADSRVHDLAQVVNGNAYTVGSNVVSSATKYDPGK